MCVFVQWVNRISISFSTQLDVDGREMRPVDDNNNDSSVKKNKKKTSHDGCYLLVDCCDEAPN